MNVEDYQRLCHEKRASELLRTLTRLEAFPCVDIHRERDYHVEGATGEDTAQWEVHISAGRKRIEVKRADLGHAIIEAAHQAEEIATAEWQQREAQRTAALAKLSPEERKLLGVR
ncbi:MAG TPA: hypothetical protein VHN11_20980 [Xanthobacteraceae bacterium]|jgi:hypothetical protein|nr:hypothetical protein [Xanthobacteraceae bacterium]